MSETRYQAALALFGEGRHAEGVQLLGQAAQAGHVAAMSLLGGQLLSGRGAAPDLVGGVRLMVAAAERGGGYAAATAATLHAIGLSGRADWPKALDYLERAAATGFPPAQAQLRLLAGREGDDWKALRRAVDIKAWRKPPRRQVLSDSPRLWVLQGAAPPAVCDWLIAQAQSRLKPATVYDTATGAMVRHDNRRNSAAEFSLAEIDLVLLAVRERLAAATRAPLTGLEPPQVLHYAVGERFIPHHDFFDAAIPSQAQEIAARGQRVATTLVYLNDDLEGGETDFPELGVRHRGRKGDALVFFNVDEAGRPDRRTLHAGLPPTSGEKWVLSQWMRDRAPHGVGDPALVAALNGR